MSTARRPFELLESERRLVETFRALPGVDRRQFEREITTRALLWQCSGGAMLPPLGPRVAHPLELKLPDDE